MIFDEAPEFRKDVKRLGKRWRSIPSDIEAAKPYLLPLYEIRADDVEVAVYRSDFFSGKRAAILKTTENAEVIKMRLDVADLGRNDKVRVVFVAVKTEGKIYFVELYAKNDKEREDPKRYREFL